MCGVESLTLVAELTRRLADQCLAELDAISQLLQSGFDSPPAGSTLRLDLDVAKADLLRAKAHTHTFEQVDALTFGVRECVSAVGVLVAVEVIAVAPILVVTRSLVEYAASAAWLLDHRAGTDERNARGLAAMLHAIEAIAPHGSASLETTGFMRETLAWRDEVIAELEADGAIVARKTNGYSVNVTVGSATVSTRYTITARVHENLDLTVAYGDMSAFAHGEFVSLMGIDRSPAALLSLAPMLMVQAVRGWSEVVQAYVGVSLESSFDEATLAALEVVMEELAQTPS
jgi:hypothetical protein